MFFCQINMKLYFSKNITTKQSTKLNRPFKYYTIKIIIMIIIVVVVAVVVVISKALTS